MRHVLIWFNGKHDCGGIRLMLDLMILQDFFTLMMLWFYDSVILWLYLQCHWLEWSLQEREQRVAAEMFMFSLQMQTFNQRWQGVTLERYQETLRRGEGIVQCRTALRHNHGKHLSLPALNLTLLAFWIHAVML